VVDLPSRAPQPAALAGAVDRGHRVRLLVARPPAGWRARSRAHHQRDPEASVSRQSRGDSRRARPPSCTGPPATATAPLSLSSVSIVTGQNCAPDGRSVAIAAMRKCATRTALGPAATGGMEAGSPAFVEVSLIQRSPLVTCAALFAHLLCWVREKRARRQRLGLGALSPRRTAPIALVSRSGGYGQVPAAGSIAAPHSSLDRSQAKSGWAPVLANRGCAVERHWQLDHVFRLTSSRRLKPSGFPD
jgi:hypothetical protein